ncbi:hypothetical protein AMELA_G00293030 [Ameiurus melas]|uniref:Uncharacterized protein n=1 Tax=Ameiurus melas TaxID=219545 RepID=A0A7J5ZM43_AMEME|nr:hypothetical protein AMELA_G00293030 [Ameiurus melas]
MELDCPRVSKLGNGSFPEGVFCTKFVTGTLSMVYPTLCPMLPEKGSRFPVTLKRSQR